MSEQTPVQKLHANLEYLRGRGASRERIQQEIQKFKASQDQVSANERKLSPDERLAGAASKMASGATFGLFDEAVGLLPDAIGGGQSGKDTQRYLQKQIAEEQPDTALLGEVAGSMATPGSFFKAAPKAAGLARKAATMLAEGAAQGGVSAAGNAEGSLEDRLSAAGRGATIGSATAGAVGGVAKAGGRIFRKAGEAAGLTAPTLDELVAKVPDEDILSARKRLGELKGRNLAHEATVADVLPQGEAALRQAATSNRAVRKEVDTQLRSRSNRLANEADERFSQHTGTQSSSQQKTVDAMNAEASAKAGPLYRAAEQEATAAPRVQRMSAEERANLAGMDVPGDKLPPKDLIDEALDLPYVQQRIGQLRKAPRSKFRDMADDDHAMLDEVYKSIGKQIRSLERKDWSLRDDLIQQRAILAEAITSRAPSYKGALNEFAGDMAHRDAYVMGHQKTPSDVIPDEIASLEPATVKNYKEGKAQALRRDVPNIDVGEHARFQDVLAPIATKEKAAVFKATFGEQAYTDYVKDLLAMAGLQKMKAGAGESTTVDKMLEQLQGDPEAIVGMIAQVLRGNPMSAIAQATSPTGLVGRTVDKLRNSKVAKTNADFLLRRGEPDVTRSLDEIIAMRAKSQKSTGRGYKGQPGRRALNVTARVVGGHGGS